MTARLAPSALRDLERLHRFLAEMPPAAARRMTPTIVGAVDGLCDFPERGRPVDAGSGLRKLIVPFGRSAYLLGYALGPEADDLIVVRIRHGRKAD